MHLSHLLHGALIVLLASALSMPSRAIPLPELQNVRVLKSEAQTRFVFDVSGATSYHFFELEEPARAVIDFQIDRPWADLPPPSLRGTSVTAVRTGIQPDGTVRYVFDLTHPAAVQVAAIEPDGEHGYRIAVDIGNPQEQSPASAVEKVRRVDNKSPGQHAIQGAQAVDIAASDSADDLFGFDDDEADDGEASNSADDLFGLDEEDSVTDEAPATSGIEGFVQFESAYTYPSPTHLSKARTILELGSDGRFSDNITWKVSGRAAYDAVFELDNFYSSRVEDNREFDAIVYETYVDISADDLEFRLGRQHIIWGEMVGLFFADVVSAKDLRQFVAQDFDLIRIPQWAARAEYYKGDYHAEVIWVPVMTYNEIGKPGDDFYPLGTELPTNSNVVIKNTDEPSNSLSNSAYGLRLSTLQAGWDISGFYYRSVDADPAFFSETVVEPEPTLVITPKHKKIHQFGLTLAKDFGPVVVKSEAIYTIDRYFVVEDPTDVDGVSQQDIVDYVVGVEHTTPGNTLLNFQVYQRWYTDHDSDNVFDEFETGASVFGKVEINSKIDAEFLLLSQLNRRDWMARPKVTWLFHENWFLQLGADIFGGQDVGLFGRFDNSDRVYASVRYTF